MALPPTIPTSFVPKQPVHTAPKKKTAGPNPFYALAYFVLVLAILGAFGVFGYKYYLTGVANKKKDDVAVAQNHIDKATVESFIRLRDRFTTAKDILDKHVELSQFFNLLESITVQGVSYKSLHITVGNDRQATLMLSGTARTFNALAAQSSAFARDTRVKRAIFSGIAVASDTGAVGFTLNANLDSSLVAAPAGSSAQPHAPVPAVTASSSPTTSAPSAKAGASASATTTP